MSQQGLVHATEYPGGVICVDTGYLRDRLAGAYLLESKREVAFIETGVKATVPRLMQLLEHRGWRRDQVRYVIVTHVHLDHAGSAGTLMQAFPGAEFVVHPRGARHMFDPSRLEASVRRVYGDEAYDATYGELVPIDPDRTRIMEDGDELDLDGRRLVFIDTPGHARHHFCVWDEATRGWFAGDTFGISYRDLDTPSGPHIFPTTTPIELDPPALRDSVKRLLEAGPQWMYLTHFGRVGDVERLAQRLLSGLDDMVAIAERHEQADDREQLIRRDFQDWLLNSVREHGVELPEERLLYLLDNDIDLNAQGLDIWLTRRAKR